MRMRLVSNLLICAISTVLGACLCACSPKKFPSETAFSAQERRVFSFSCLLKTGEKRLPLQGLYQYHERKGRMGLIMQQGLSLGTCVVSDQKIACQTAARAVPKKLILHVAWAVAHVLHKEYLADPIEMKDAPLCTRELKEASSWHCHQKDTDLLITFQER